MKNNPNYRAFNFISDFQGCELKRAAYFNFSLSLQERTEPSSRTEKRWRAAIGILKSEQAEGVASTRSDLYGQEPAKFVAVAKSFFAYGLPFEGKNFADYDP